jgi:hypothetical protein
MKRISVRQMYTSANISYFFFFFVFFFVFVVIIFFFFFYWAPVASAPGSTAA